MGACGYGTLQIKVVVNKLHDKSNVAIISGGDQPLHCTRLATQRPARGVCMPCLLVLACLSPFPGSASSTAKAFGFAFCVPGTTACCSAGKQRGSQRVLRHSSRPPPLAINSTAADTLLLPNST